MSCSDDFPDGTGRFHLAVALGALGPLLRGEPVAHEGDLTTAAARHLLAVRELVRELRAGAAVVDRH
ncbi:hypothetical protein JNUCC0626_07610 [Lentzea sp. JNUCC 0626]|uniref:hypothetical protein n=1 Tax=Lentzea sp. JNUCC 0626 TaxID=3367513 RepID=UPI00374963FE